jgi:hypothetical protein
LIFLKKAWQQADGWQPGERVDLVQNLDAAN